MIPLAIYRILEFRSSWDWISIRSEPIIIWNMSCFFIAELRKNKRWEWAIMIDSRHWKYVWANFRFQKFTVILHLMKIFTNFLLQSSWFLSFYTGTICTTLYFSSYGIVSLQWLVWAPLLYSQFFGLILLVFGKILDKIGQDSSVSKSNWTITCWYVWYSLLIQRYVLYIPLNWLAVCVKF